MTEILKGKPELSRTEYEDKANEEIQEIWDLVPNRNLTKKERRAISILNNPIIRQKLPQLTDLAIIKLGLWHDLARKELESRLESEKEMNATDLFISAKEMIFLDGGIMTKDVRQLYEKVVRKMFTSIQSTPFEEGLTIFGTYIPYKGAIHILEHLLAKRDDADKIIDALTKKTNIEANKRRFQYMLENANQLKSGKIQLPF